VDARRLDDVEDFTDRVKPSSEVIIPLESQNAASSSFVVQTDVLSHQPSMSGANSTFRKYQSKLELWNLDDENLERYQIEVNRVIEKLRLQNERRGEAIESIEIRIWKGID